MQMIGSLDLQILNILGRFLLNPLIYLVFLLLIMYGARRIKRERIQFGKKIYPHFNELNQTFLLSLFFGFIISIASVTLGLHFTLDMLVILSIVMILLVVIGSFNLLSPVYTVSITFFIFMLLPLLPFDSLSLTIPVDMLTKNEFITLALLVSALLFVETTLIYRARNNHVYPSLTLSERGTWLGEQHLKRIAIIPLFFFIPESEITYLSSILPYFQYGNVTYYLVFVPFVMGTHVMTRVEGMNTLQNKIGVQKLILSLFVLLLAMSSYHYFILSFVAIIVAIIGNEWITYRNRLRNQYKAPNFVYLNEGVKVLATLPGSKAEQLHILPGETIMKVNGVIVSNSEQFYKALQLSGPFFKLDILDEHNEIRFIRSAFYNEDHHELGLIFPEAPYGKRTKARYEQLNEG